MGETSGYLVDPISAKKLLSVLCRLLDIEVDPTRLSDRAKEMEQFIAGLKEESERDERRKSGEDLVYIG
jgi:proteasome assembly chaperone (PAC2) family protein